MRKWNRGHERVAREKKIHRSERKASPRAEGERPPEKVEEDHAVGG